MGRHQREPEPLCWKLPLKGWLDWAICTATVPTTAGLLSWLLGLTQTWIPKWVLGLTLGYAVVAYILLVFHHRGEGQ